MERCGSAVAENYGVCFKRFRHIDSHFASKQILKGFERF